MSSPQPTSAQPMASTEMTTMNSPAVQKNQEEQHEDSEHNHTHEASRHRGGGAKNCFLGMMACFFCCGCCEVSFPMSIQKSGPHASHRGAVDVSQLSYVAHVRYCAAAAARCVYYSMLYGHKTEDYLFHFRSLIV
ncbi:hypothetical protein D9756_001200 [Leucocoprinus leucothites]|uniref:Uncharacterized protein n=1 Tax=Leucocoprinus leucothites TaxID=201217 RepID=A0A8H5G454_9AGAR|nr:hypothetical protein D9756_001200 [Leucoagaricus leucothites]